MFSVIVCSMDYIPHFVEFLISSPTVEDLASPHSPSIKLTRQPPHDFTRIRKLAQMKSMIITLEALEETWGSETWIQEQLKGLRLAKADLESLVVKSEGNVSVALLATSGMELNIPRLLCSQSSSSSQWTSPSPPGTQYYQ
jgi:hypothetical protein